MTQTNVDVPDDVFEDVRRHYSTEQVVELTALITLENARARFNRALQVEADGFCRLPATHPALAPQHHH
jgi:alkylhydroperoxidase family enzyme